MTTDRVIAVLGVLVLGLGGLVVWRFTDGGASLGGETDVQRVRRQASALLGPTAEVRLLEEGRGRTLCGYVGIRGDGAARAFVSRPNRLLLADDPLKGEFHLAVERDCPTMPAPPQVRAVP